MRAVVERTRLVAVSVVMLALDGCAVPPPADTDDAQTEPAEVVIPHETSSRTPPVTIANQPNGSACVNDAGCATNNCVHTDGLDCGGRAGCVCCTTSTCAGICSTCHRASALGTCGPKEAGVPCRAGTCSAGSETEAETCDGVTTVCPGPDINDCSPYLCGATACRTSCTNAAVDCDPNAFCNAQSMCEVIANECTQNLDTCDPAANCTDPTIAVGDFMCACPPGYSGDGYTTGTGCTNIDECTAATDDCVQDATCMDNTGSFTCDCPAGFTGDGRTSGTGCNDIDECAMSLDDCDDNATCGNTTGSFTCTCNAPAWSGNGQTCADVDECAANLDNCDTNATCTNTTGSFTCLCNEHWSGTGTNCTDADECATGTGGCGTNEVCTNQVGAANTCECAEGFSRAAAGDPCLASDPDPDPETDPDAAGCCQSNADQGLPTLVLLTVFGWARRRRRPTRAPL